MSPNVDHIISSIKALTIPEQDEVRSWFDERPVDSRSNGNSLSDEPRQKAVQHWMRANRMKYLGQWVALDGDRLIASGTSAKEVYEKSKAQHVSVPFVDLVVEDDDVPFTGGWLS